MGCRAIVLLCACMPLSESVAAPQPYTSPLVAHALRLLPGDDLGKALVSYCSVHRLSSACVLSCVGSLDALRLRLAGADDFLELNEPLEIVSLVGTVCANNEFHLHMSVSKRCGSVVGGHLKGVATVATTAEIMLAEMPGIVFDRLPDDSTG